MKYFVAFILFCLLIDHKRKPFLRRGLTCFNRKLVIFSIRLLCLHDWIKFPLWIHLWLPNFYPMPVLCSFFDQKVITTIFWPILIPFQTNFIPTWHPDFGNSNFIFKFGCAVTNRLHLLFHLLNALALPWRQTSLKNFTQVSSKFFCVALMNFRL